MKHDDERGMASGDSMARGGDGETSVLEKAVYPTLVHTAVTDAMDTRLLQIECGFTRGFAGMQLIGNASEVCRDGKERARAALEQLGLHLPPRRLVVSLTPADVKKDGSHLDLPIAVSLALLLSDRCPKMVPDRWVFAAEVGLSGELRPVKGVVSFAIAAMAEGLEGIIVAPENLEELGVLAALRPGEGGLTLKALGFDTLKSVLGWIFGEGAAQVVTAPAARVVRPDPILRHNFDDMILHPMLEKAAIVSSAGMHSILLRGSPGTGKSMLASRLASILPPLAREEHIEALRIYSGLSERLPISLLDGLPPFRAPHHQASAAAILGGPETPGEMALAHGGVLFLDELPEFRRDLLESLREPLETGEIRVSRSRRKVIWKCRVILVAACNNCPCGWNGSSRRTCSCASTRIHAYVGRISGPILDRIDMHVNMPEPEFDTASLFLRLGEEVQKNQTARMRAVVEQVRHTAEKRNRRHGVVFNADLQAKHLAAVSGLSSDEFGALVNRRIPRSASSRSVLRCLRVARTLADVAGRAEMSEDDVDQAWRWQAEKSAQERGDAVFS
jgi:magnesium chelatase family protein